MLVLHDENHPLTHATVDRPIDEQVNKQLSYQFDWVMTYPPPTNGQTPLVHDGNIDSSKVATYGCNLVRRKENCGGQDQAADNFTFLATRLDTDDDTKPPSEGRRELEDQITSVLSSHPNTRNTLKIKESIEAMDQAVSPSLTHVSEVGSIASPAGSFSGPRIEDSLEEIDRLEDEIEAVNNYTNSPRMAASERRPVKCISGTPASTGKAGKRVTIAPGQSATLRVKPSEKMRPALRRPNSMDLRENQPQRSDAVPEQKAARFISRPKAVHLHTPEPKVAIKSTKPVTVPHFELPGEAVSRRLKQQREARQAQQAEAQKAAAAPTRTKSSRPLTKPNFELPGEAISRRKREEREAKLKAQEEEERRRREFKARPFKSNTVNALPRETIASRARQGKTDSEDSPTRDSARIKRLSTSNSLSRLASVAAAQSPQGRGRNSVAGPSDDGSRATSASTSLSEKRSSVSVEDISQQRLRGREIYARDNSYSLDREKEKREREAATRLAREQAAERSRAASREWAEKQRQRELSRRQSLRTLDRGGTKP